MGQQYSKKKLQKDAAGRFFYVAPIYVTSEKVYTEQQSKTEQLRLLAANRYHTHRGCSGMRKALCEEAAGCDYTTASRCRQKSPASFTPSLRYSVKRKRKRKQNQNQNAGFKHYKKRVLEEAVAAGWVHKLNVLCGKEVAKGVCKRLHYVLPLSNLSTAAQLRDSVLQYNSFHSMVVFNTKWLEHLPVIRKSMHKALKSGPEYRPNAKILTLQHDVVATPSIFHTKYSHALRSWTAAWVVPFLAALNKQVNSPAYAYLECIMGESMYFTGAGDHVDNEFRVKGVAEVFKDDEFVNVMWNGGTRTVTVEVFWSQGSSLRDITTPGLFGNKQAQQAIHDNHSIVYHLRPGMFLVHDYRAAVRLHTYTQTQANDVFFLWSVIWRMTNNADKHMFYTDTLFKNRAVPPLPSLTYPVLYDANFLKTTHQANALQNWAAHTFVPACIEPIPTTIANMPVVKTVATPMKSLAEYGINANIALLMTYTAADTALYYPFKNVQVNQLGSGNATTNVVFA